MNAIAESNAAQCRGQVSASLNYLGDMHVKPYFHVHDRKNDHLNLVAHSVTVTDAREARTSLDEEGFCLLPHRSSITNLHSKKAVLCVYGREMATLVRELTGASKVTASPLGVLRVGERSVTNSHATVHRPVRFVHADYTTDSAVRSMHRHFHCDEDPALSERRYAIYHVWRALTPAPQDAPLALCDPRTVSDQDCIAADTILDFPGSRADRLEAVLFRHNPRHRWYYFPNMTPDEVIIFKDFDSDARGPCRVPHTAFDDPTCPSHTPARVSLDLQLFAVF